MCQLFVQEMKGIVIFNCALLSVISIGEAAMCRSTVGCPDTNTTCTLNCSRQAEEDFNQPASHGNCRISVSFQGEKVQGCFIHECNNSHPDLCIPEFALDGDAATCCCTEDDCNDNFSIRPENHTNVTGDTYYVYVCMLIVFQILCLQLNRVILHTSIPRTLHMLDQVM